MKIIPSDKQQQLATSTAAQPGEKNIAGNDFAKVLQNTVQKSSGAASVDGHVTGPSLAPTIGRPPVSKSADIIAAEGLLDALENYQALLGDPNVNLRAVETSVETMSSLSESVGPMMDKLPEGHPVKQVVGEALVHISKEKIRFKGGLYVDR